MSCAEVRQESKRWGRKAEEEEEEDDQIGSFRSRVVATASLAVGLACEEDGLERESEGGD